MADDFLMGAACCSSVENPGMVMFQARSVLTENKNNNIKQRGS